MSIYVEILICGRMDELWEKTQSPRDHERWDLRFSSIEYLPRPDLSQPQRFRYSTRLGFGLCIQGEGEAVGGFNDVVGRRTSSLRFSSADPKSLIREGAGYWQYDPTNEGIRFITSYDYHTRFGWFGRTFDRYVFRPLIGWATAWSFDNLRLWIERGIDPATSVERSIIHAMSVACVGLVWIYQGLIPKLVWRHHDEFRMLVDAGIPEHLAMPALACVGSAEVLLGLIVLRFHRHHWPFVITIWLMILATIGVSMNSPQHLISAFNPITLNLLLAVTAAISLLTIRDLPSARNCLRKKPESQQ